jgi:hypothetical protein
MTKHKHKHVTINDDDIQNIVVVVDDTITLPSSSIRSTGIIFDVADDERNQEAASLQQWYSSNDIKEFRRHATIALSAINQSCGDFDVEDTVGQHSKTVLAEQERQRHVQVQEQEQQRRRLLEEEPFSSSSSSSSVRHDENTSSTCGPEQLATLASQSSKGSMEMARFYALVLEQEVRDASVITLDVVSTMVNTIFCSTRKDDDDCDCQEKNDNDANEDDTDTIGTIDEILLTSTTTTTTTTTGSNHHPPHPLNLQPDHRQQPMVPLPTQICFEGRDGGAKDWKNDQNGKVFVGQSPEEEEDPKDDVSQQIATSRGKRKQRPEDCNSSSSRRRRRRRSSSSSRSFQGDVSSSLFSSGIENTKKEATSSFSGLFPPKGETNCLRRQVTIEEERQQQHQQQQQQQQQQRRRQLSIEEETQTRCNVSYALISLVRWEFRCHEL